MRRTRFHARTHSLAIQDPTTDMHRLRVFDDRARNSSNEVLSVINKSLQPKAKANGVARRVAAAALSIPGGQL